MTQLGTISCDATAELFSQHYPMLEYFKHRPMECPTASNEFKTFLEKHTKLVTFESNGRFLWTHRDVLAQTNFQLDSLILFASAMDCIIPFNRFADSLRQLYDRKFYKRLQVWTSNWIFKDHNKYKINMIFGLPKFEKLTASARLHFNTSGLINLTELKITSFEFALNAKTLAKHLPKLEHLTFCMAKLNMILPFLRQSKRLQTIKIDLLSEVTLDIVALNQERMTLKNACQTSIYVQDNEYLTCKWASDNLNLELDFIKIKRLDFVEY